MKHISYWASRHSGVAIFLLILGQFMNAFNGLLLGSNLLENKSLRWLYVVFGLLIFGLLITYQLWLRSSDSDYWLGRNYLVATFLSTFFLFGVLGGIWNQQSVLATNSSRQVLGSRRIEVVRDTLEAGKTLRSKTDVATERNKLTARPKSDAGKRIGYILLAILGVSVSYLMAAIACNILCAGYGFLGFLTLALGLGGVAGSVYFLSRVFRNPLKRRQDMAREERRRDLRVFWFSWIALILVIGLLILIG